MTAYLRIPTRLVLVSIQIVSRETKKSQAEPGLNIKKSISKYHNIKKIHKDEVSIPMLLLHFPVCSQSMY